MNKSSVNLLLICMQEKIEQTRWIVHSTHYCVHLIPDFCSKEKEENLSVIAKSWNQNIELGE